MSFLARDDLRTRSEASAEDVAEWSGRQTERGWRR